MKIVNALKSYSTLCLWQINSRITGIVFASEMNDEDRSCYETDLQFIIYKNEAHRNRTPTARSAESNFNSLKTDNTFVTQCMSVYCSI